MKRFLFSLVSTLLLAFLAVNLVAAQDPTQRPVTDDQVNAIAKQLYCPVCENIPLDVCGTQACEQWRGLIREKLAAGWSETQIKQYFVDQYGDRVLGTPPARGLNWLVYIVPPLAILAGAYILYRAFRAWKQPLQPQESAPSAAENIQKMESDQQNDPYIARMEEELRKR